MHSRRRPGGFFLPLLLCTIAASLPAGTASARHPGWLPGAGHHGCATGSGGYPGWGAGASGCFGGGFWPPLGWSCGIGSYRSFESVTVSGVGFGGFFSGGVRSVVVGTPVAACWNPCGWNGGWNGGWGRGWWGGCGPVCPPIGWCQPACVPWGWGGWVWPPIIVSPFGSWLPAGVAPVFGPPGVYPYLGLTASRPVGLARDAPGARRLAGLSPARQTGAAAVAGGPAPVAGRTAPVAGRTAPVRTSNRVARLRSGRLVAQGDRALRAAVADADRLREAIDAYGRAATIAPDLPDTRIRQALALVAAGRHEDAAAAIASAVRLDRRLAGRGPPPAEGLVADPVFGDRLADTPAPIAGRGRAVLAAVMASATAALPDASWADGGLADNWIAAAWARRFGEPAVAIARR
ncbi:MAG: hypothetical protein EBR86_08390 [Planctomycetia bacterium]|nr:hypothetical protein [Planctomycetia bacterium]